MESTFSLDCRELFCLQTRKPRQNVQTILHSTVCAKRHNKGTEHPAILYAHSRRSPRLHDIRRHVSYGSLFRQTCESVETMNEIFYNSISTNVNSYQTCCKG